MGLILAIIGGIAGWKTGEFHWRYFAIMAVAALVPAVIGVMMFWARADALTFLAAWLAAFAYLAIPFTALAWLKRKRLENRSDA